MSKLQSIVQNSIEQWENEVKNSTTEWVRNRGQSSIDCLLKTTSVLHKIKFVYSKISDKHSASELKLASCFQLRSWLEDECLFCDKNELMHQLLLLTKRLTVDCPCEECSPQMHLLDWHFS